MSARCASLVQFLSICLLLFTCWLLFVYEYVALSPNHSFAMDNVLRGHSTRKDKSKTGMGRSARIADQASKVVRQLKKFSPQVDTQLTKEETLQAAAVKATEILTHMPDNNEGIDTTQSISPHWTNHFKKLDIQRTGMISYDDFSDVLITAAVPTYNNYSANATASANTTAHLTSIPVSRKDAYQLALKLDPDKTGLVNYEHLAPALKHAVEETSKAVAEQAVKRLGELSLEQLTNPHLKLQNEEEKQFHHKVSLLKDSELNAGVGAEYGKHNISAVRVGRFSPRFRGDGGNLDSSQGMVTISDVAGKAYGGVDSGSGNGTDLHSLTSPIYNRFKRSVTIEDTLEPPSQGRNSAPLITSPILGNGGHNPCVKSTAPHDHSYNFRDNSGSEYTASLLANTYADNTQFAVIDEISTGRKTHYNANRHTAFAWQFESDRRSKGRGGGSLNGSTAGTLSLGESFQSQQQQIQFRPANSGAIAGAETFDFTDSQSPTNSRAARRSHSAPPIRAKGFKTLGEMGRLNNNNGSDKENEVWSDQQQQQQQLSLNIDTSVAPSPSLSAQADEQSHYDLEHAHSLRTVVFSPKPTASLLVPSSSSGALKSTRTATTVENEHLSAESRFEKFNIPNSIISQLGGGKRLGSLRHALRQVDGSNSGVVNYSEFREALVNKLGLKLKDSEVRQLYNKNSLTTSGSVADRVTASTVAGSNTNTLGDCREKSVNIDEFVCNLQTRATSHMFGLHKGAVTVMKDATNPHNVIRSTREEERVIKKVLHATNKILCQDPVKVFSDMAKQTNAAKMDRGHSGHSSSETSHRVYSDSLLSDVTLRDFQDGLKYMGADLSDAEFYTLSKVLLTNNNSTNHNKSEHEVDHNFTVDRDNNAGEQVTEVDITNDSTRLNVKNAFDAMNRTVLLVDRVRSQEREDKLQKEGRYSASYKSHPSIVDHYHHHHFDALLENKKVSSDATLAVVTVSVVSTYCCALVNICCG